MASSTVFASCRWDV